MIEYNVSKHLCSQGMTSAPECLFWQQSCSTTSVWLFMRWIFFFFFFFFWRTPRLFGYLSFSSSRNPVNAQIVQHVIGFVSLGFPDHLPAPLPWPPLPPPPPSPPLAWGSRPALSLSCCRLPQLSGQHHLSSLQTLLVTNIILHFKHHSHHCLKC